MRNAIRLLSVRGSVLFSICSCLVSVSAVSAQDGSSDTIQRSVPGVVVDAQLGFSLSASGSEVHLANATGVAVAADGTIYVADEGSSRIVRIVTSGAIQEKPSSDPARIAGTVTFLDPPEGLSAPNAVAVSSDGTLYFADARRKTLYRVKHPESATPAFSRLSYSATQSPVALAVDSSGVLWVADATQRKIIEFGPNETVATHIQSVEPLIPTGIAVSKNGIYVTDAATNAVYGEGKKDPLLSRLFGTGFHFEADLAAARPTGLAVGYAGNVFVLDASNRRLVEFRPSHPGSEFIVPFAGLEAPAGLAMGPTGNLYITDHEQPVTELIYGNNTINFGEVEGGKDSSKVALNYFFNKPASITGLYQKLQGGKSQTFVSDTHHCLQTKIEAGYSCQEKFHANYSFNTPGLHKGVIGLSNAAQKVVGAIQSNGNSQSALVAFYPAVVTTVPQTLLYPALAEPQGVVVNGTGTTMFVADEGRHYSGGVYTYAGEVWAYPAANGVLMGPPVNISGTTLQAPTAVALDGAGNLYIADWNLGAIYKASATNYTNIVKITIPSGVTLYHPISLAFDPSGNLFIGDSGAAGIYANASNPGFIVRVATGFTSAAVMHYSVGTAPVIFPQGLTTDTSGNLYIADGGDSVTNYGDLAVVKAGASTASAIDTGSYTLDEPSGLVFDAAMNLYVLDGYNDQLLLIPVTLSSGTPSFGAVTQLQTLTTVTATSLAIWPQGQLTITDIGPTVTQVITLQTNTANLGFGPIPLGSTQDKAVTTVNIGSAPANFGANPPETGDTAGFSMGSPICAGGIAPQQQCALNITYNPDVLGASTAQFSLTVNGASAATNFVNLSGTSTGATPTVVLNVTATSLTYPNGENATVTVSGNFGTPSGSVGIYNGSTLLVSGNVGSNGIAYLYIPYGSLPVGTANLTAVYAGSTNYTTGTSAPVQVMVAPESVPMTLSCYSSNNYNYGSTETCTASMTSGNPTPTGNVVFTLDSNAPVTVALVSGAATFMTSPSAGSHSLVAAYAQQGNYAATSATQALTITKATTYTSLSPSSYYLAAGPLTLSVSVVTYTGAAAPTGVVNFTDSLGAYSGQCTLVSGACSVSFSATVGMHSYTAAYAGTANYGSSNGSVAVTVH